jgi:hypothetical protein
MKLKEIQGKDIATFLGYFTLHFPNRELTEDQSCRVLILEALQGQPLATVSASKLAEDKCRRIREQVIKIVKTVQENGILFPVLYLDKFFLLRDSVEVRLFGFGCTFDPKDLYETENEREDHANLTLAEVEGLLEDYGFGASAAL